MTAQQTIFRERRQYNQWVANETLEDYALRFTAKRARRWSAFRVANTALGTVAFLALEAIGGSITLTYGFSNATAAILAVGLVIFLTGIPICYYAAKYGVDIDLLTRGAGFGYIGSTVTSLIYASFTFIFFALEASIMSLALEMCLHIPLPLGYLISALFVIPLVTHGITLINRFQFWSQFVWLGLQLLPFIALGAKGLISMDDWTGFVGTRGLPGGELDLTLFGSACGVIFALIAQNAEQVDFLRFLPPMEKTGKARWWIAVIAAGPGWVVPGIIKLLAGSLLAVLVFQSGVTLSHAADPSEMYFFGFRHVFASPELALAATGIFVVISQLKINVTNAYAGSLAWSNFFSRLTHTHPGRVVWLIFNVALALLLMEVGIYKALQQTLGLYSNIPVAWLGAITADLVINKPLGLSPRHIEFKRAYLYDINPVGLGSMFIAAALAIMTYVGLFGPNLQGLSPFVALSASMLLAPLIAWATRGRYYLARENEFADAAVRAPERCCICENVFEPEDMAHCPVYAGPICSLCCTLDARCHDACKTGANVSDQLTAFLEWALPEPLARRINSRLGKYISLLLLVAFALASAFALIWVQMTLNPDISPVLVQHILVNVFFILMIFLAIAIWPLILAQESGAAARQETQRQTAKLMTEIEAHGRTDRALQEAKEVAEAASLAKSKYVRGISHELRTPLNAIVGYGQLLEGDASIPANRQNALRVIRRSGEHLSGLVDGLLDISMIEAGRLQIARDEVRLTDFLGSISDMFRLQAQQQGIAFRFEPAPNLPAVVHTDEKRLRQVLINLLSNALRCTREGHVVLKVGYRNQVATFDIEDTGVGIAAEDLERIFQPFERIESAHHPARYGTGLGLTITKLLTEAMGGQVTVKSTPGQGSCFRVRLMLSAVTPRGEQSAPLRAVRGYEGPRKTILVVDDDPIHVMLMRDVLTPLGFCLLVAIDGRECLSLATSEDPDAVLLDISLPGMDGWEVSQRLREDVGYIAPIVMISANAWEDKYRNAAADFYNAYLIKPIQIASLLETLSTLMGLDWIYDAPNAPTKRVSLDDLNGTTRPSPEELGELIELASIGHMRGILDALDGIAANRPGAEPLLAHLRGLAEKVELAELGRVLKDLSVHGP